MPSTVLEHLAPVRRRQRRVLVLRAAALGLLAGGVASVALLLARWWVDRPALLGAALALLVGGPIVGALVGARRRLTWQDTAEAVDRHYGLKDRVISALEFTATPTPTEFQAAQVRDTLRHLARLNPPEVVPLRWPRSAPFALAAGALAVVLLARPFLLSHANALPPDPLAAVLAETRTLEEQVREIEAAAKELQSAELQKLAEEMRRRIEEMKQPGVDFREAMAKVSQMQAALAAQMKEFNVALVDDQLQNLGKAMDGAGALEASGKALQEKQYDKAARELEQLESVKLDKKGAQAAGDRMDQAAKEMKDKGLQQLGKATDKLAKGVKGNDKKQFQAGARDLAKEVRNHERRSRIMQLMAREQQRLADCKERCERYNRNLLAQNQKGNPSSSPPPSAGSSPTRSDPLGERSRLPTQQKLEEIQGKAGAGPAEVEDVNDPQERTEKARRPDREVYQKYRRMSEAALENERIPLGHRQAIRRYFELIRPQSADTDKKETPGPTP
jgi:hypothetical protein